MSFTSLIKCSNFTLALRFCDRDMVMRFYPGRSPGHHYSHSSNTIAVPPNPLHNAEDSDKDEQVTHNIIVLQDHDDEDANTDDYGELAEFSLENLEDDLMEEESKEEGNDMTKG